MDKNIKRFKLVDAGNDTRKYLPKLTPSEYSEIREIYHNGTTHAVYDESKIKEGIDKMKGECSGWPKI